MTLIKNEGGKENGGNEGMLTRLGVNHPTRRISGARPMMHKMKPRRNRRATLNAILAVRRCGHLGVEARRRNLRVEFQDCAL
jgi:hypothetical protein